MTEVTAGRVVEELRLTPGQVLALRALQARMLLSDVRTERDRDERLRKRATLQRFVQEAFENALRPHPQPNWVPWEPGGLEDRSINEKVETFTNSAASLAGRVVERSASLVIVVELLTFSPWEDGTRWDKKARQAGLEFAAAELGGLREGDLQAATAEFESLMKALRRKSIKWGRVAAATAVGAGIGVLTAGWAAPAIGGVIGGTMGLTGAAATSAGLAALGGGSLAAGGFGVAGGTLLLSGLGGFAFAGAAAAGTRFSPIASRTIAAEAVKLDLIARLVLADSPNRDEKMRRVVESLQETINNLSDRTKLLVDKIDALKAEKAKTDAENESLKEELAELKTELREMRAAATTLEVVRDRLPEMITA